MVHQRGIPVKDFCGVEGITDSEYANRQVQELCSIGAGYSASIYR